jgi:hypothetical protein
VLSAAILIDGHCITKWQLAALDAARELLDIRLVLSCQNTRIKKAYGKHFLYYALNFWSLKNDWSKPVELTAGCAKKIEFDSVYQGNWQKIPDAVAEELVHAGVDVVIKFGMSLLRVEGAISDCKILSFHHGDPSQYRGRPAGFYELLHNRSSVGTIVQELSNKLDAGKVWAIAHSRAHHHSYQKTAANFYANSRFLLKKALINLASHSPADVQPTGKNYTLPSNAVVMQFVAHLLFRKLKRALYGAFFEKRWNIATHPATDVLAGATLQLKDAKQAVVAAGYNFYADPFFSLDGTRILLEALDSGNGLGDIIELNAQTLEKTGLLLKGQHYSYPYPFQLVHEEGQDECLLPEVADHSAPYFFKRASGESSKQVLKGLEHYRVVDGSLLENEGIFYLFCGMNASSADCLYLFCADGVDKEFKPHPLNPIVIDPSRARMGGRIVRAHGKLYRFGQNNCFGYGDGITVCEITKLSTSEYEEVSTGSLRFADARGPHTVDTTERSMVFDFYADQFSLLAGYRRLVPILLRRFKRLRRR